MREDYFRNHISYHNATAMVAKEKVEAVIPTSAPSPKTPTSPKNGGTPSKNYDFSLK
jgi:hypothetical protein